MSLTCTLYFGRAFIGLASDPSTAFACGTAGSVGGGGSRSNETDLEGSFRAYANGVIRLITGSTKVQVETVVLRALTPIQLALIESWIGKTVLFRDTYGRKIYGAFLSIVQTTIPLSGKAHATTLTDVALAIQALTYTEAV